MRDLLDRSFAKPIDDRTIQRPLGRLLQRIAKRRSGDRALAAAAGADDQSDLPVISQRGELHAKLL